MDIDEITHNIFYHLLRNKYRKEYEHAISKCWTICVPSGDSIRDISITKEFIDDHILKPLPDTNLRFTSSNLNESHLYAVEECLIKRLANDKENDKENIENVSIISVEKGYNKEFQPYNIFIIEKPLRRKYCIVPKESLLNKQKLNHTVTCYKEAMEFFDQLPNDKECPLDELRIEVKNIDTNKFESAADLTLELQSLIRNYWANTMRKQNLDLQRDARFQKLLSTALEIFVMYLLHDNIYLMLSEALVEEDAIVREKIDRLIDIGVTPDQLGVQVPLALPLPSAVVELATLDSRKGPLEKLHCMRSTLDFIVAEIKCAMANVESKKEIVSDSNSRMPFCAPGPDDLIPLLLYVIVKSRSQRIVTDLHYIQNFLWSVSPHDGLSYALTTYQSAISLLHQIDLGNLPPRNEKVKTELHVGDILQLVSKSRDQVDTPLDQQMLYLAKMLEDCTKTPES